MATTHFMIFLLLKSLTVITAFESESALQFYNDYEKVFVCQFRSNQANCSEYSITLPELRDKSCKFKYENVSSQCNCYIEMVLIVGEQHKIQFRQKDKLLVSRGVNVSDTIKPKAPINVVVKPTAHGHFLVSWKTNYENRKAFSELLAARVTYWKNGGTKKEGLTKPSTNYEIRGDDLEPNSNYTVIVQNFADLSQLYSDSSPESFFVTAGSTESLLKVVVIVISLVVIILTSAFFWCYIILKSKLWDEVPKPTVPQMSSGRKWVLLPSEITFSPVYTEHLKMDADEGNPRTTLYAIGGSRENLQPGSGIGNGSSSMSYAQTVCVARDDQAVSGGQMRNTVQVIDHVEEELSKVFSNLGCTRETNLRPVLCGDYSNNHTVLSEGNSQVQMSYEQLGNNVPLSISPSLQTDFSYQGFNGESQSAFLTRDPSELFSTNESNPQVPFDAKTLHIGYQSFGEVLSKDMELNLRMDSVGNGGPDIHSKVTGVHQLNPSYIP